MDNPSIEFQLTVIREGAIVQCVDSLSLEVQLAVKLS